MPIANGNARGVSFARQLVVSDELGSRRRKKSLRPRGHENVTVNLQACYDLGMRCGLGLAKGYHNTYANPAKSKAYDEGFTAGTKMKLDKRPNGK